MAEKEYIEREAALSSLDELEKTSYHNSVLWPDHVEECREALRSIPAADVRPVANGKWEPVVAANEDGSPYQAGIRCSECGHFDVWEFNFCPNCGADMREES